MDKNSKWLLILILISGCICSTRTECSDIARIAVVMNLNSDFCKESLLRREFSSNGEEYPIYKTNYTADERDIEIMFLDSCGSTEESVRLIFKVVSWSSLNCLKAPYFLGFIGPEDIQSLEASVKITEPLKIPYITNISASLPYIHHLISVKEFPLLQVIFELINDLKWKSFIFEANINSLFEKRFVQQFLEKLSIKNLCILPLSEISAPIIYIGDINIGFLNSVHNSTILVIGGHNIEQKLVHIQSTNLLLLLSDARKMHKFSTNIDSLHYPRIDLNKDMDISNFIFDAVNVYSKALNHLCKNENCISTADYRKWNDYVVRALSTDNFRESYEYELKVKNKNEEIQTVGHISKNNNKVEIQWGIHSPTSYNSVYLENIFEGLRNKGKDKNKAICMTYSEVLHNKQLDHINKYEKNTIVIPEVTNTEWWIMVGTVIGVGIAMFTVGFFAVYIVYTNIRGSQQKQSPENLSFERDSSVRRISSNKQMAFTSNRNSRLTGTVQRRDSRSSIRSNISDKSV